MPPPGETPAGLQQPWGGQPGDQQPWGQQTSGQQRAPYGAAPGWGAPPDPAATQAAWRYSARAKNNTVAWLLWIGGPFLVGLPIHDFYFGAILRGLLKLGLIVLAFVCMAGGIIATAATADNRADAVAVWPMILGFILFGACFLAILVWWIVDGVTMTKRLEQTNDRIRREIAAEQGVDPWSF